MAPILLPGATNVRQAVLYPWYEVGFYPAADARTPRCPDDWVCQYPDISGGGRDG